MATRRGFIRQGLVAGGALGLGNLRAEETFATHAPDGEPNMNIGVIVFPRMDQIDFTGPFEVLSRVPGAAIHVLWKEKTPVRDIKGLILTPEQTLAGAPQLDVLVVPGGPGQEALMEDEAVLSFIRDRAEEARYVYSGAAPPRGPANRARPSRLPPPPCRGRRLAGRPGAPAGMGCPTRDRAARLPSEPDRLPHGIRDHKIQCIRRLP